MAAVFDNVLIATYSDNENFECASEVPHRLEMSKQCEHVVLSFYNGKVRTATITVTMDTEHARLGKQSLLFTNDNASMSVKFPTVHALKTFQHKLKEYKEILSSVFSDRTDEASAVQYFQFYGYLSQQQNMMQDYIRTSTYQRAMLHNISDFNDKVVLDVGAGSGILSFFAIQAGARKVYAIEASSMAQHCEMLVQQNNLADRIVVIPGKVEEVDVPEQVDVIISEPMGYMLFNERMLESYLHAKKWLKPDGRMFPTQGDLHIAPFTDDALYMEQYSKANFWYQESFHGVNLTSLRNAAVTEYFKQPIVDTFDVRICMAKPHKYTVNFQSAAETDLHVIEIPLTFSMVQSGSVHGLAFWFDVGFFGSEANVWLSTSPTEPLTHWYQVRCLLQTPVMVKQGQVLTGRVLLRSNTRQSYDVDIELQFPGTATKSTNTLDLKNPYFRYTGQPQLPPPGTHTQSATDVYWNNVGLNTVEAMSTELEHLAEYGSAPGSEQVAGHLREGEGITPTNNYLNGILNGVQDAPQNLSQQGVIPTNLIAISSVAPINPGSIPSVGSLVTNSNANRTSIGGGLSPIVFTQSMNVISGGMSHYPVSNQFMIGDYVMPGSVLASNTMTVQSQSEAV